MGCDIHCYIEYRRKPPHEGIEQWSGFGGRINPGRDYAMFGKLAGVRNYSETQPIAEPRGYPDDAGYDANDDYWLYISDYDDDGHCTKDRAEEYIKYGSRYRKDLIGNNTWVSSPDWHSVSWLTPNEWEQAVTEAPAEHTDRVEYKTILDTMRSFERQGYDSRIVFWFDN